MEHCRYPTCAIDILCTGVCYHLVKKTGLVQNLEEKSKKICLYFNPANQVETIVEVQSVTDSLPDRLIHPAEYEPMLLTSKEHTHTHKPAE